MYIPAGEITCSCLVLYNLQSLSMMYTGTDELTMSQLSFRLVSIISNLSFASQSMSSLMSIVRCTLVVQLSSIIVCESAV